MIVSMHDYTQLFNSGRVMLTDAEEDAVLEMAKKIAVKRVRKISIGSPSDLRSYLRNVYYGAPNEMFGVVWLDNQHRVISFDQALFNGTIDGAAVYPRVVVREALKHNAQACVICHNHPSGSLEPSQADIELTTRLKDALELVDCRVLDHIICGAEGTTSFAERGMM